MITQEIIKLAAAFVALGMMIYGAYCIFRDPQKQQSIIDFGKLGKIKSTNVGLLMMGTGLILIVTIIVKGSNSTRNQTTEVFSTTRSATTSNGPAQTTTTTRSTDMKGDARTVNQP